MNAMISSPGVKPGSAGKVWTWIMIAATTAVVLICLVIFVSGVLREGSENWNRQLFSQMLEAGQEPVILDSRELLTSPRDVLRQLCEHIGLQFTPAMLSWKAGPRPEDGVWAPHWYHAVHRSTGFAPYRPKTTFPDRLRPLLAECQPWYDRLFERAIRADARGANQ